MKPVIRSYALFASAIGAVALLATLYSLRSHRALGAAFQQPGLPLNVMFDPSNLDVNTQQVYQAMQDTINGFAFTPADRTTYYSAVNNVNGYVVNGWQGIITNVQQNADGYLVSIDVAPGLSTDTAASAIIIDSDYSEQYQVFPDGTFQYVGALDPQGLAGQMPTIVGL